MSNTDTNPLNLRVTMDSQTQRELLSVKVEESEIDPIKNSSKKRRTDSVAVRNSPPTNGSPEIPASVDGVWRGNAVGKEAKELLDAVDQQYPETFQGLPIRGKPIWLQTLNGFHVMIKKFMEKSVDEMKEEDVTSFQEDLDDFEGLGFDLSWARKRLEMVKRLKFGNEPLLKELMSLEESLDPIKLRRLWVWKQLMEAHEMWKKVQLEYDDAASARDKKVKEMTQEFGAEFDRVLKGNLGIGILPGF